jgi:hypothetical protein
MPILTDILSSTIGDTISKIVGIFKVSPEKQLEASTEITKIQLELQGKLQDALTAEVQAASANIQADAKSGDKYTSRARPSFIYVMLGIFICNYIVFPLIDRAPLSFPEALFWLFGSCMLGYTGARTWEKLGLGQK